MSDVDPPLLPRLSVIGWSIDETSDLHAAVFDIADGGASGSDATQNGNDDDAHRDYDKESPLDPKSALPATADHARLPLRPWAETEHSSANNRSPKASLSDKHHDQYATVRSDGQSPSLNLSREQSHQSDTMRKDGLSGASKQPSLKSSFEKAYGAPARRRPASRGTESSGTDVGSASQTTSDAKLSRAASIFKLKRPFRSRKSSVISTNDAKQSGDDESLMRQSSGSIASSSITPGLSERTPIESASFAKSADVSPNGIYAARDGTQTFESDRKTRLDQLSKGLGLDVGSNAIKKESQSSIPKLSLPESDRDGASRVPSSSSRSRSSSPHGSSSREGTRRKRDLPPPLQAAPKAPLPPLPQEGVPPSVPDVSVTESDGKDSLDDEMEHMIIGRKGDPVDEEEDMLMVPRKAHESSHRTLSPLDGNASRSSADEAPSTGSMQRILRKTKSQSNVRLARTRSILTSLRPSLSPSSAGTSAQVSPSLSSNASSATSRRDGAPWDSLAGSRLELGDSSPETERISLSASEDHSRDNASSPSLEEARRALSPGALDKVAFGTKGGASILSTASPHDSSKATSPGDASGANPSRLESSGGASGLFGGGGGNGGLVSANGRQRASSLLPWRQRANSQANTEKSIAALASTSKASSQRSSADKPPKVSASGFEGDAEAFVRHVTASVSRTEVPSVLSASGDELHKEALRIFMQSFLFAGHPLDVSLRKLLMSLCLPKETQQIDRVMEAFARRYNECNENLFTSHDQPYMLAFSLMMLHTDTFNRNAKQKMSKADYVRNTSASGVATEILEYLYDNLTFTQFIYVEDEDFLLHRRKSEPDSTTSAFRSAFMTASNSVSKSRVDPYHIIASGQTHTLRPEIQIDEDSPFSATGTIPHFDIETLLSSFVNAPSIEIVTARKAPLPSTSAALGGYYAALPSVAKEEETIVTLRITKVGCISRKDDFLEEKKKAPSRKWKTCGMILSSTQLLFFRDLVWTSALDKRIAEQMSEQPDRQGGVLITPRITYFKPDGVLALGDAVAVRDASYSKYKNVFRLLARQGDLQRQYLIQCANEADMNDWIHKINFCSAFRSAGLRIRGLDVGSENGSAPSTPAAPFASSFDEKQSFTFDSPAPSSPGSPISPNGGIPAVGLLRRKLNARMREFNPVIEKVTASLQKKQTDLDEKLRLARHIMIATPFMKSTRERLEALSIPLAQEIRQLRLEVARWASRRDILLLELEAGNRAAKASAPSTAFDESVSSVRSSFGVPWTASYQASTATLGLPSSVGTMTPVDGASRSGSFSISRTSSFSQSRAGSIPSILNGDSPFPLHALPAPAIPTELHGSAAARAHNDGKASSPSVETTPTMHSLHLHGSPRSKVTTNGQLGPSANAAKEGTKPQSPQAAERANFDPTKPVQPQSYFQSLSKKGKPRSSAGPSATASSNADGEDAKDVPSHSKKSHSPSSPREADQERWDRTKMGRDADKRISLVTLPDASQQWLALATKKLLPVDNES